MCRLSPSAPPPCKPTHRSSLPHRLNPTCQLKSRRLHIKSLFDNLPHELLLKAVQKHVKCKWALLYIERWLTAPVEKEGLLIERTRGSPQGGVISPLLSH